MRLSSPWMPVRIRSAISGVPDDPSVPAGHCEGGPWPGAPISTGECAKYVSASKVRMITGGASEPPLEAVDLVLQRLPAGRDGDLAAGLLDQGAGDVLLPLQRDKGGGVVEPHEDVEDVLHRLEVVGGPRHVPPAELLEGEPPQLPDRVPQAQEVRRVRRGALPRP